MATFSSWKEVHFSNSSMLGATGRCHMVVRYDALRGVGGMAGCQGFSSHALWSALGFRLLVFIRTVCWWKIGIHLLINQQVDSLNYHFIISKSEEMEERTSAQISHSFHKKASNDIWNIPFNGSHNKGTQQESPLAGNTPCWQSEVHVCILDEKQENKVTAGNPNHLWVCAADPFLTQHLVNTQN